MLFCRRPSQPGTTIGPRARRLAWVWFALAAAGCAGGTLGSARPRRDPWYVSDLPLAEVPAKRPGGHTLVVIMTGDGGWLALTPHIARALAERGFGVVGLEMPWYLARPRTPEGLARDMDRVLHHYLAAWGDDSIVIVGYSRGADFVPFVANRLSPELRGRLRLLVMISPSEAASFRFHLLDLIMDTRWPTDLPTLPEVVQLRGIPMLCVYGDVEKHSLCTAAPRGLMRVASRHGGHMTSDARTHTALILEALGVEKGDGRREKGKGNRSALRRSFSRLPSP